MYRRTGDATDREVTGELQCDYLPFPFQTALAIATIAGPHDGTGEEMFTIQGTPEANEKALYSVYNQLVSEKERRVSGELAQRQSADGAAAATA